MSEHVRAADACCNDEFETRHALAIGLSLAYLGLRSIDLRVSCSYVIQSWQQIVKLLLIIAFLA